MYEDKNILMEVEVALDLNGLQSKSLLLLLFINSFENCIHFCKKKKCHFFFKMFQCLYNSIKHFVLQLYNCSEAL